MKTKLTLLIIEIKIYITRGQNSGRQNFLSAKFTNGEITGGEISRGENTKSHICKECLERLEN